MDVVPKVVFEAGLPLSFAVDSQAIAILPQRHNAHKNLGLALMGQGRLREAAESFRRARDLSPTDGRAEYYLAMVEERLRNEAGVRDPRLVN